MQSVTQPAVEHSILSAGVDWITCTAQQPGSRLELLKFGRHQRERFMDAGVPIKLAYRLGFDGWQAEGFFYGQREGCTMVIASGATAHQIHRSLTNLADNISRLDLQVTVATPLDRPHLGVQAHAALTGGSPARVKVKNFSLIDTHPQGETLSINRRSSDFYGRLYDKAAEGGILPARTVWRYEVEVKRSPAKRIATTLAGAEAPEAVAGRLVWDWYDARGVAPIYIRPNFSCTHEPPPAVPRRDVLSWFRDSLSTTVARAVHRHGVEQVIDALGLSALVVPNHKGGE